VPSFGVGPVNLRWILVHMIDETARHAGHLDLLLDAIRGTDRRVAFHRSLASKRMGAGAVIRNADGDVLIVKPTYKEGWELPGGAVEANESPAAGCARELREELGLDLPLRAMLCVDYNPTTEDYLESLMFLFDAGTIDQQTIDAIRIDPIELAEFRFVPLDQAVQMLLPRVGRRLRASVANPSATNGYLEDQVESLSARSMCHSAGDPGDSANHALVYSEAELYEAAFGYRDYGSEWSFLESLWHTFGWNVPSPHVVEIAAGPAGHALVAARAGWISHALDTSAAMVELGRTRAREVGVTLDYTHDDMETFSLQARCHLAITMLDSISYLTSNDQFLSHLSAVRDALVPGGLYVIELDHPTAVFGFDRTTESSWTVDFDGAELRVEWIAEPHSFDPITQCSRISASFELWSGGTRQRVVRESAWQREFTLQEIDALAKASGAFEIVGVFGGFDLDLGLADDGAWRTLVALRRIA
jgi:8-oxo-dGTP pyrophosphatase MutT (NUDIX family)/SAM-dependent methyltransferase